MTDCGSSTCKKKVSKSAKALACDFCRLWYHMTCAGLTDADYDFMKSRRGLGFRWYCVDCMGDADNIAGSVRTTNQVDEKLSDIVAAVDGINQRLVDLEAKATLTGDPNHESFADVVKRAISEVKKDENPNTKVTDHGQTRVIRSEEVLVLKPREQEEASAASTPVSVDGLGKILKSVPVKSCRETSHGTIVVKFPHGSAKEEACALMRSSDDFKDISVSEPKKMQPKMTLLDIPPTLPDEDIIPGIKDKNPQIKALVDAGHTLTLVFCRTNAGKKMAVVKMSPDIRSAIVKNGNRVFLCLASCRAFDRFWAIQCRHCQKFGHTKDRCPAKNASPTCCFCADSHLSISCPDKTALKCVNCSSLGKPHDRCCHSASSLDCPVMNFERKKVMENTDFGPSKNL